MKHTHGPARFRLGAITLLAILVMMLAACQGIPAGLPFLSRAPTATVRPVSTNTPRPTETLPINEALPATFTPGPAIISRKPTQKAALPALLADFPLFSEAPVLTDDGYAFENSAGVTIRAAKSPGELDAFYRKALPAKGWLLRYAEGNAVGGFVQEWRKDQSFLTVEYHFAAGQPVVSADLRVIDSKQALVPLMGFPLPNGTIVTRSSGAAVELFVPLEYDATIDFFRQQVAALHWRFDERKPTDWCGSQGCQETPPGQVNVSLEPLPTPDSRKTQYYRIALPDYTRADITFLPHGADTRVYININFKNLARSGIPVAVYPDATVTGIMPGVAMFEVKADIKDVIKFYEDGMAGLGWKEYEYNSLDKPDMYVRHWQKNSYRGVTLSLSTKKGKVYGTLTCTACRDPLPTTAPTAAPSK